MAFQGANTQQLRAQASLTRQGSEQLRASALGISRSARSVTWYGEDAERFRESCSLVVRKMEALGERLTALEDELGRHAEEQDTASDGDGSGLSALFGGLLGGPFGGMAGGLLGLLGGLRAPAGSRWGGLPGENIGMGNVLTHDAGGAGGTDRPPIEDEDFKEATREGDTTLEGEVHAGAVKGEATQNSQKITLSEDLVDLESKGTVDLSKKITRSQSVERIVNDDGTLTYVFEASLTDTSTVGADGKVVDGSVTSEVGNSHSYSVTVPAGTSVADAAAIDPFDPSTLPSGSSATVENSLTGELSATAGVTYRGVRAGADVSVSEELTYVTTVARGEDGTISVDQGPGTAHGIDGGFSVGVEDVASIKAGIGADVEVSTVEHARFTGDESGMQAAQEALLSGAMPEDTGGPVLERYQDVRETVVGSFGASGTIGSEESGASGGASTEFSAREKITRTYPDGHQVWEARAASWGKGHDAIAVEQGETGRAPTYMLDLGTSAPSLNEMYPETLHTDPHSSAPDTRIAYTEQELRSMMEYSEVGEDPFDYLATRAMDGPSGAERMYYDYKHLDTAEQEMLVETGQASAPTGYRPDAPGQVLEPGQTSKAVADRGGATASGAPGGRHATPSAT
ncbi:hypothetical protein ACTXMW_13575 [Brachybacterium paraconglomeratum]|uniref:hypothetical protein n=1 Tax=Brachybacterium paraconglomeratum TaxID=173362 RepID=UPI003FD02952